MRKILVLVIGAFLFSACSSSSLYVTSSNTLVLEQAKKQTEIATKSSKTGEDYFSNITLKKYRFMTNESALFYETMEGDINYELKYTPIQTLGYIFDASNIETIYKDNHIHLVQLGTSTGRYVNVLAESTYVDRLNYVYGFSNESFKALATTLAREDISLKYNGSILNALEDDLSVWSVKMLLLRPLVQQNGTRGAGF